MKPPKLYMDGEWGPTKSWPEDVVLETSTTSYTVLLLYKTSSAGSLGCILLMMCNMSSWLASFMAMSELLPGMVLLVVNPCSVGLACRCPEHGEFVTLS